MTPALESGGRPGLRNTVARRDPIRLGMLDLQPQRPLDARTIGLLAVAALAGLAGRVEAQQAGIPLGLAECCQVQYRNVRIEGTVFHLTGDVDVLDVQRGIRLLADVISFDTDAMSFEASGNVSFEQGGLLLNGSAMRGDLDDATLEMEDVIGVAPGPFYVRASYLEQVEPGKFRGDNFVLTPCNQSTSIWEFRGSSMTFKPGKYVRMAWPHVRVKGLPLFGLPFMVWPLQDSARQTGLLIPALATSSRKGFSVAETFFWAINRSADLTLSYEHYANAGNGYSAEFRHALGDSANGSIRAYFLPGKDATAAEQAAGKFSFEPGFLLSAAHYQSLPGGLIFRVGADTISSTQFARQFQDNVAKFLQRQSYFTGELTKSWGANTLSLVGGSNKLFEDNSVSTIGRRLPMLRYSLRSTQLLGPIYVAAQASAARLQKLRVEEFEDGTPNRVNGGVYNRFDAFPDVSVQLTQIPWLTFNPFFRYRSTYWSHRHMQNEFKFRDKPIFRSFYETGVEMVGPQLFKIYDTPGSSYSPRVKHVIQPRLVYRRVRQIAAKPNQLERIILFDEIDSGVLDSQSLTAEITTRLFAKRYPDPNAQERMVWQAAEITIGHISSLEPLSLKEEAAGVPRIRLPWFLTTRFTPTGNINLQGNMSFTPSFTPANYTVSAEARGATSGMGLSWFRGVINSLNPQQMSEVLVSTSSNTLQAWGNISLFAQRLTLGSRVGMDLFRNQLQNVEGSVQWNLQCCSIGLDARRLDFSDRQETQIALLLNLAQVGTFGFDSHRQ